MIASLSLGGAMNTVVNAAVAKLSALGVVVIVAAGNAGKKANAYSPASSPSAITVGATVSGVEGGLGGERKQ